VSEGEDELAFQLDAVGLEYLREFRFHPTRKWRADFCVSSDATSILVEVEGGTWANGRHNRGYGMVEDIYKYNAEAIMGYRLLRFTPEMVTSGEALVAIEQALGIKENDAEKN
jgi:hypothetical protein